MRRPAVYAVIGGTGLGEMVSIAGPTRRDVILRPAGPKDRWNPARARQTIRFIRSVPEEHPAAYAQGEWVGSLTHGEMLACVAWRQLAEEAVRPAGAPFDRPAAKRATSTRRSSTRVSATPSASTKKTVA